MVADKITIGDWSGFDESKRYNYSLTANDIVFDIGSYRGEFADEIRKRFGCYVECFEALDNKAAGIEDGKIEMGGNFLYTSFFSDEPKREFKCVDIARYVTREIALVKMNIEGFEYILLPYMIEKGLMRQIKNLQVQFHIIDGEHWEEMYLDIAKELSKTHKLTWRTPFVWENWERI